MWVGSLGWEDPLEEGMAAHFSILAWRIPETEEYGGLFRFRHSSSPQRRRLHWACVLPEWVAISFSNA